jgi:poly-gamma-glutamate synthesis protein (capsule biosynthesis protein)
LKVPAEWAQAAAEVLQETNEVESGAIWQLDVGPTSADDLADGWVDAVLIEGGSGLPVGERPIALAVPFTSQWETLTLKQAEEILDQGSDFIQAVDWAQMQPDMKSIPVEGFHPSEPDYPLQRSWSLLASDQAGQAAEALIPELKARIEYDRQVEIAAVGDLMLARAIGQVLEDGDLAHPFEYVLAHLQGADLTIGNLESALGDGGTPENKGYTFRAPPQAAQSLALAGFDLLSIANNHAMDYGPTLLMDAILALETEDVAVVGAGQDDAAAHQPYSIAINGLRLAFLSFVDVPQEFRGFDTRSWQAQPSRPGLAWADAKRMRIQIEQAQADADIVIVLLHSGYEYVPQPSPPQITAARTAVEAGADLVIGHHAHILQPIEFNPSGMIVYGLGNFVFEDAGPPESAMLRVWLDANGVRELQFIPVRLDEQGRPHPVAGEAAEAILTNIYSLTNTWRSQTPARIP